MNRTTNCEIIILPLTSRAFSCRVCFSPQNNGHPRLQIISGKLCKVVVYRLLINLPPVTGIQRASLPDTDDLDTAQLVTLLATSVIHRQRWSGHCTSPAAERTATRIYCWCDSVGCLSQPHRGLLQTQKLKTHLLRTQSSKVLPFKPGEGQNTAMQCLTNCKGFLSYKFLPSQSIYLHFFQILSPIFPVRCV